jgi:hypothetical protein
MVPARVRLDVASNQQHLHVHAGPPGLSNVFQVDRAELGWG